MARQENSTLTIILIIVGILACSVFVYFQIISGMTPADPPVVERPAPVDSPSLPAPPPEPEPELGIPSLDASDEVVRSLAAALSAHPQLATWLAPDDLVRRIVASVVNVANDESPRPHVGFLAPAGNFRVTEAHGELYLDPRSYLRYDRVVEVFSSIESDSALRLYRRLKPLFDEAYRDLGYPAGDFDAALLQALDRVLATPIPSGRIGVRRRVTSYRFTDPELEALSPVQKHLLRMGPDNAREVKGKLRSLRRALSDAA